MSLHIDKFEKKEHLILYCKLEYEITVKHVYNRVPRTGKLLLYKRNV